MSNNSYPLPQQLFAKQAKAMPNQVFLRQPINRVYKEFTWKETYDSCLKLASGYRNLGLEPGDKICILSKNVAEWFIADFAAMLAGLVCAPIYPTAGEKTIAYVIDHSEAKAIVIGKLDSCEPTRAALKGRSIITISMPYESIDCDHSMSELIATNEPLLNVTIPDLDDVASLAYTSGSTGDPKGAVLTYRNIAYGSLVLVNALESTPDDRVLSYLPLAHIMERISVEYQSLYAGFTVTFLESLETFAEDLKNCEPTSFVTVPRLWMKLQMGILAKMPQQKLDRLLKIPVISGIVKNKIKKNLGFSHVRFYATGSAPISSITLEWFRKIGIEISEGWGMTETSCVSVVNFPFNKEKIGTIGKPVEGTEIKISEQGEILVKSDGVIKEYYKEPKKTAEAFIDGWLHTGDKGEIDADGFIRITGRVKDIFKSGKGKYVVPVPIESLLFENTIIEQVCVMGSGLPQPVAAVVLAEEISASLSKNEIDKSLDDTLIHVNERLEGHEKLDRIIVTKEPWSIENGLLTPTLKIKRSELEGKYQDTIAIESRDKVVWQE